MKKLRIKELVDSIVKYGHLPSKYFDWIFSNFSRQELKLFSNLLSKGIKYNNVIVSFSGKLSDINKKKINMMFRNKKILFRQDDNNIVGGVRFEYDDFILDYSISGTIEKILKDIKENL
ncbi:MAG: hypothetical protein LBQ99_01225 [Endomicrobium sp.]|jgi:F-type H+-transporting ATPase subunit delta|nr:hypothetical protein [Endomicrobium sp.]